MTNGNLVRSSAVVGLLSLSYDFIFFFQNSSRFLCELRSNGSAELNVSLNLFHSEFWIDSSFFESVHVDDMVSDVVIFLVVLFIKNNEEDIESGHKGRSNIDVISERSGSIVATEDRIGSS